METDGDAEVGLQVLISNVIKEGAVNAQSAYGSKKMMITIHTKDVFVLRELEVLFKPASNVVQVPIFVVERGGCAVVCEIFGLNKKPSNCMHVRVEWDCR